MWHEKAEMDKRHLPLITMIEDKPKEQTYYVVEVSLYRGNPVHRTIMRTGRTFNSQCNGEDMDVELYNFSYKEPLRKSLKSIYFIDIISEVKDMIA